MPNIEDLTAIPEQEYNLYIADEKAYTTAYGSDDAYSARFRYDTQVKKNPKSNYFGHAEIAKNKNYISPFFRGAGEGLLSMVQTGWRGAEYAITDALVGLDKYYYETHGAELDQQIKLLEHRRGVDKMSLEERKDFYKNDPEYNKLYQERMKTYDELIDRESPEFDKAVRETYDELKKQHDRWRASFNMGKKEEDSNFSYELGEGAGSLVGALGVTAATKNPTAAAAIFGELQAASVYEELREKGVEASTAIKFAAPAGVAEGALEKVGLHLLIDNMAAKTWVRGGIKSFLSESLQEGSQQTVEEVLLSKFRTEEEMSDKMSRVGYSMLYGGILGSSAAIAGRPFMQKQAAQVYGDLTRKYNVDEAQAKNLVSNAVFGNESEQAAASEEIQKIIGKAEMQKLGFDEKTAEALADKMVVADADQKKMILQAANAELDPDTFEGGSIESGAKFMDEKLQEMDLVADDFDIKEKVKQTALENGVSEDEAELAGTLTESFARVMTNVLGETPREQWENGGALLVEDERQPNIENMTPLNEDEEERLAMADYYAGDTAQEKKIGVADEFDIPFEQSAFHGSPHRELEGGKFSLEKIGEGEGAQAHGHGFYFALNFDIADKRYRERLVGDNNVITYKGKQYEKYSPDYNWLYRVATEGKENTIKLYQKLANEFREDAKKKSDPDWWNAEADKFEDYAERTKQIERASEIDLSQGQVFEVDIPENVDLLDEQKSIYKQRAKIKNAVVSAMKEAGLDKFTGVSALSQLTGGEVYDMITKSQNFDQEKTSELLSKYGIKGITYEGREDGRCFVIFNPEDIKIIRTYYQGEENDRRGYIQITELGNVIHLLKTADKSTIVHELGHYFVNRYLNALKKAGKIDEAQGVLDWLGVASVDDMTAEHHEKFARGFETYVMEGIAPNAHTQTLFTRFKNFLIDVYRDLTSAKIINPEEINDDVRSFFDQMLAVDEAPNIDIEKIKSKMEALKEIASNAAKGKEVSIDGVGIEEINDLVKALNARLPRKPKNLTQLLRASGGINQEFAKMMDIDRLMGLQDAVGGASGLFVKNGGIDKEDSLVEFLKENGFIHGDTDSYEQVSALWDKAISALENADNLYTAEGQEIINQREALIEAAEIAQQILGDIDFDTLQKSVKELRKNNIAAVNKDTLKYIKGKLKQIESDYKKLMKDLLKAQKSDFAEMQKQLLDFIKAQPLTADSKVKLLSALKKAKSKDVFYRVLNDVAQKAAAYYDNERCKAIQKQIQKELKATRPHGIENQKYDYENNVLFADLRKYNKMTKIEAEAELGKYREAYSSGDAIEEMEEADKIRMRFLTMKAKGASSSFELLQAVLKDIQDAKALGRMARDTDEQMKAINREEDRQELLEILSKSDAEQDSKKTQAMNAYRRGFANLYSLLNSMFGKKIADKYQFETEQANVDTKIFKATQKSTDEAKRIFGVDKARDLVRLFAEMVNEKQTIVDMEGIATEVNRFQIMDIYNAIKNEKSREDYYAAYGEEVINSLVLSLSAQERAYADYLMNTVNSYYDMMNKVYISLYATDLPKVENYWPATSEHRETIDILGDFANQSSIPSALKERSKGRVIPKPKNAMEKFNRHIAEAEYISNLGVPYMEMKRVFKSRRVKAAIVQHFGENVYKDLMTDIDTISLKQRFQMIDAVSGTMNKIINNVVLAKIALAPSVFMKQLVSCTNYTEQMPAAQWLKGFLAGISHPKETWDFMMKNAEFLQARLAGGNNEALVMALAEKRSDWRNALSIMTRYGDMAAIVYGGYPYLKSLMDAKDPEAVKKFEFATLRSQQSGTRSSLSPYQQSTGVSRILIAFKNTPMQYMRKIVDSFVMYKNGDIDQKQFSKTLFNYAVVQPALLAMVVFAYQGMTNAINGEEDDDDDNLLVDILEQIVINPLSAVPLLDDVVDSLMRIATGQRAYGMGVLLFDDINKSLQKLNKKDKDFFDWAMIFSPIVEATTSAPSGRALNAYKKATK